MTFEHNNAKAVWTTVRIEGDSDLKTVMMIETDLILNHDDPKHDADAVKNLLNSVQKYYKENNHIDRIDISQIANART